MSAAECDELIAFGETRLQPAEIVTVAGRDNWDKKVKSATRHAML